MIRILSAIVLLNIFFLACSSSECNKLDSESIKILEVNSWLNLMPGGPGSFHISGEFELLPELHNPDVNFELSTISVYSDGKLVYDVVPVVNPKYLNKENNNSEEGTVFQFGTNPGLEIDERLMANNIISAEFHFTIGETSIVKTVTNIEITRAF